MQALAKPVPSPVVYGKADTTQRVKIFKGHIKVLGGPDIAMAWPIT